MVITSIHRCFFLHWWPKFSPFSTHKDTTGFPFKRAKSQTKEIKISFIVDIKYFYVLENLQFLLLSFPFSTEIQSIAATLLWWMISERKMSCCPEGAWGQLGAGDYQEKVIVLIFYVPVHHLKYTVLFREQLRRLTTWTFTRSAQVGNASSGIMISLVSPPAAELNNWRIYWLRRDF